MSVIEFYEAMPKNVGAIITDMWVYGGYRYTTNGEIVVREPAQEADDRSDSIAAKAHEWLNDTPDDDFIPLPDVPFTAADMACISCKGKGKVRRKPCKGCDGTGDVECDLGHTHECGQCDGNGFIPDPSGEPTDCEKCGGDGKDYHRNVRVGVAHVQARYIQLIGTLPGVVIQNAKSKDAMIYFRFDGGSGVVMPIMV